MTYQVKLDVFEGPLDLLLHLIDKNEMDIYDIQISKITDQYLGYIQTMQALRLDIASEFLVMASTLLYIKSKTLLPSYESDELLDIEYEEEDPREELIQRLIEYKKYKETSGFLKDMEIARSQIFTRPPANLNPYLSQEEENPVEGISLYNLVDAFERAMVKLSYRDPLTKIERDEVSIKDRMIEIKNVLLLKNGIVHFSDLISSHYSRTEVVITFLSLLELMKQKAIICIQSKTFDDIVIHQTPEKGEYNYGLQ